jgi:hypothetical protein
VNRLAISNAEHLAPAFPIDSDGDEALLANLINT